MKFLCFVFMFILTNAIGGQNNNDFEICKYILKEKWFRELPPTIDTCKSFDCLFDSLDPYTKYLDSSKYRILTSYYSEKNKRFGFMYSNKYLQYPKVTEVTFDSPVYYEGLLINDRIKSINGISLYKKSDYEISQIFNALDTIKFECFRFYKKDTLNFSFICSRRDMFETSVSPEILVSPEIGYIKIYSFRTNSYTDFMNSCLQLKWMGIKKIIIDVRDNPGGLLDDCLKICDQIIGKNHIIIKTKNKKEIISVISKPYGILEDCQVIVLINNGSASASEILAGSIQQTKTGILIGEPTFGKGLIQQIIPIKGGSALKCTISEYYLENDVRIDKWSKHDSLGLIPDISIKSTNFKEFSKKYTWNFLSKIKNIRKKYYNPDVKFILKIQNQNELNLFIQYIWCENSLQYTIQSDPLILLSKQIFEK